MPLIDLITEDPNNGEYVMYLVEDGPWPEADLEQRLRAIQTRLYDAIEIAIDGQLASKFPNALGKPVRIQLDCYDQPPSQVDELVTSLNGLVAESDEWRNDIDTSPYISGLRITTGHRLGRIRNDE